MGNSARYGLTNQSIFTHIYCNKCKMKLCLQVLGLIFRKVRMGTYFKQEIIRVRYFLHG